MAIMGLLVAAYVVRTLMAREQVVVAPTTRNMPTPVADIPVGTEITAKTWAAEAALRMLMNNLDPEVAERPEDLVVYGGIGKAARNWACFDAIVSRVRITRQEP